jgi:CheY-like chemotaxis protein
VLVVEDDPTIVELLEQALEVEGYQVLSGVGGEALQLAQEGQPDVILLDIMMPDMDGIEVSRRLRADPATSSIPIVAMSAHERLQAIGDHMSADDRLSKPFHLHELYDIVSRWVRPAPLSFALR